MFGRSTDPSSKPQFYSWGRYPRLVADVIALNWSNDFPLAVPSAVPMLPVALGRIYGYCCLLDHGTLLSTRGMNRLLNFDPESGFLCCEGGVSLAEILDFAVPRGWFLPVTPRTKYVTVGRAIANDIHGKNHHVAGTVGCHVPRFKLARFDHTRMECSPTKNAEWFRATIGGFGLTGLITRADVKLRPIVSRKINYRSTKFTGIDEFVELSRASSRVECAVAWIDCVSKGNNFARGIFMQSEHLPVPEKLSGSSTWSLTVPVAMPAMLLNHFTVGAFNSIYYHKQLGRMRNAVLNYEPFSYPLDSLAHWNRIYGRDGMLQFQCVLPMNDDLRGMTKILRTITASGLASLLAVIKVSGDKQSPGMMSFPRPDITLALDFPVRSDSSVAVLDRLSAITLDYGGRIYPAKDARMTAAQYQAFYPQFRDFSRFIDPALSSAFWQRVISNV